MALKREPTNRHDIHAVAIYRDTEIVGHVPYNLVPRMSAFFTSEREQSVCRNHRSQSQQGSWLWSGSPMCLPSVDNMKKLVKYLLADVMDIIISVTAILHNDNWGGFLILIMGVISGC